MTMFTQRTLSSEHMDDPQADRAEQDQALRFIRTVNRRLGGAKAALRQFERWSKDWKADEIIRVLDVGTGSADIPLALAKWAQRTGRHVRITAVDLHPVTLELAREFIGRRDDIGIVQADALKLMDVFSPGEFHYAHAGMFLHHLNDVQVMTVLRIMDRLTTRGVIWNDLVRGAIGKLGARVLTLGAPAEVKHDAIVSVDAGFARTEAIELANRAGLERIAYRTHLLHRFVLTSEKTW